MRGKDRPDDFADVVRANHEATTVWIVAASEPCIEVRDREVEIVQRNLVAAGPEGLPEREDLPASWMVAVLVCPGDDLAPVATWTAGLPVEAWARVRLYVHPDVDLVEALAPWYSEGLDDPYTAEVESWEAFHKQFGADLNNRVYWDAR